MNKETLNFWKKQEVDPVRAAKLAKLKNLKGEQGTPSNSSSEVEPSQESDTAHKESDAAQKETDVAQKESATAQKETDVAHKESAGVQEASLQASQDNSNETTPDKTSTALTQDSVPEVTSEAAQDVPVDAPQVETAVSKTTELAESESTISREKVSELESELQRLRSDREALEEKNRTLLEQLEQSKLPANTETSPPPATSQDTSSESQSFPESAESDQKYQDEINRLLAEIEQFKQLDHDHQELNTDLTKKIALLQAEIETLKKELEVLSEKNETLATSLAEITAKYNKLEESTSSPPQPAETTPSTTETPNISESEEFLALKKEKEQLELSLKQVELEKKEIEESKKNVEGTLSEMKKDNTELKLSQEALQQKLKELDEVLKTQESDPPASTEAVAPAVRQEDVEKLQKTVENYDAEVTTELEKMKQKIADMKNRHREKLKEAVAETESRSRIKIKEIEQKNENLLTEKEQVEKLLVSTKSQLKELKSSPLAAHGSGISLHPKMGTPSKHKEVDKSLLISWFDIKIGKRIGSGGFAEVFEGVYLGERVAVKKLTAQDSTEGRRQLMDELQLMASLHSGYVVHLYGAVVDPPNMCIVMEFYPRGSLGYILWDKNEKLPWGRRWQIARDAALAMNYLHSRSPPILHRDLKSGNFLIGSDWRVRLTDFGCSTTSETVEEEAEFLGGTLVWTAPEVLDGIEFTTKSDVYSFGMCLMELATRKQPWYEYEDASQQLLIRRKVADGHRPNIPSDVPADFKKFIEMCWAQRPEDRSSFPELIRWLNRKGHMDKSEGGGDPSEKLREDLAAAQEELELQRRLNETAERRAIDAEKAMEREKSRKHDLERDFNNTERRLQEEKSKRSEFERLKEEKERELSQEKSKRLEAERKRDELEKKVKKEKKKIKDLQDEKEEAERRRDELEKRLKRDAGRRERYGD